MEAAAGKAEEVDLTQDNFCPYGENGEHTPDSKSGAFDGVKVRVLLGVLMITYKR